MKPLFVALALTLAAGCVPKQKYNTLSDDYASLQAENTKLKAALDRRDEAARERLEAYRALVAELKPLVDRGLLQVEVVDGRVVIGMASDVLFASGSATLSDSGRESVREVAKVLARLQDREWQVEGHTDDDPIATAQFPNNWVLGSARAITVVQEMVDAGLSPEQLSAASFAEYAPVAKGNKARNRRIEIVLLPDLSDLPGYESLMEQGGRPGRRGPKPPPQRVPKRN